MDWAWWIDPERGMPLLVAMIASFTSVIIAVASQLLNSHSTRRVLQEQLRAQDQDRWSETKYDTFASIVTDVDRVLKYVTEFHDNRMRVERAGLTDRTPVFTVEDRTAFKNLEKFPGNMQLLAPETRRLMHNVQGGLVASMAMTTDPDNDKLFKVIVDTNRSYSELLNAMRTELGLSNGRATFGITIETQGRPNRLARALRHLRTRK